MKTLPCLKPAGRFGFTFLILLVLATSALAESIPGRALVSGSDSSQVAGDNITVHYKEYVFWHTIAQFPLAPSGQKSILPVLDPELKARLKDKTVSWEASLGHLARFGDAYSIHQLRSLKTQAGPQQTRIKETIQTIETRLKRENGNDLKAVILARLSRAAYADVTCAPIEHSLVSWMHQSMREGQHHPEVKAVLQELRLSPVPVEEEAGQFARLAAERIQRYAVAYTATGE